MDVIYMVSNASCTQPIVPTTSCRHCPLFFITLTAWCLTPSCRSPLFLFEGLTANPKRPCFASGSLLAPGAPALVSRAGASRATRSVRAYAQIPARRAIMYARGTCIRAMCGHTQTSHKALLFGANIHCGLGISGYLTY
jgi:hypothetical protein